MSFSNSTGKEPVIYSLCSGYNYYYLKADRKAEIFGKSKIVVQHVKTGELFYLTDFPDKLCVDVDPRNWQTKLGRWVEMIRTPVDLKHFIWPVDIVIRTEEGRIRYSLVFPLRALPPFKDFTEKLMGNETLGRETPWVMKAIENFLDDFSNLSAEGFAYHEFSKGNMFYTADRFDMMFDFNFSTVKCGSLYDPLKVDPDDVTPDFADPYFYTERAGSSMDMASDYYSVAVILFKLLVGILPYQGSIIEHEPNSTQIEHENWIRLYHKNTYFVFDVKDKINHIGGDSGFAMDELYVSRWDELPIHVKNMFHNVFQLANVQRKTKELIFYSPAQWKDALFGGMIDGVNTPLVYREASR